MSRKRQLKKERARSEELERQIERLSRNGADDAILELVQGRAGELSPAAAAVCDRASDRALRRALGSADLPRAARLLRWIGRDRSRPLPALAEAVAHLDEGRLADAQASLAGLGTAFPPGLVTGLAALCAPGSEWPGTQEVRRFHSALAALQEGGFRARPSEVEEMRQSLAGVAGVAGVGGVGGLRHPPDAAVKRLLDAAAELLRLLAELADVEEALRRRPAEATGLVPFFLDRTRFLLRPLLAACRDEPPAALLRSLRHALRLRWRTLLETVLEQVPAAWADLYAAAPELLTLDLELSRGSERLRNRAAVRELRESGRHPELATLLASLSAAEKAPERTARLWSLELWAWEQAADDDEEEADDPWSLAEPPQHAALVRLGQMAGEIAGRLPAEQRPEVARFLRARLIDLCDRHHFCSHVLEAAGALLRHLPDDPGLLVLALAAAESTGDGRARKLFDTRIAARGAARSADREALVRLLPLIVPEGAELTVRVLPSLRPLFGEAAWPEALDAVLESFTGFVCTDLRWSFARDEDELLFRQDLELYRRSALAERPGFAALEAAFACLRPDSRGLQAVRRLLDRSPELEAALTVVRVLTAGSGMGRQRRIGKALESALDAAISRLDLRWRLWWPQWPALVMSSSARQTRLLAARLRLLLRSEGLGEEDREVLEKALATITGLSAARAEGPRERRPRKPRRRRAEGQLSFDL